ncbi:MAG: alpha-amylase family glycosyl hydrolase [Betaproteobacteria bacterium]|jgi:glycosidase
MDAVRLSLRRCLALLFAMGCCSWAGVATGQILKLHVPSPDWRDQVIYFVVTDRFADGDPANNDFGAGEFKAGDRTRFNGGDLKGLTQRLEYIRGLGASALWITPPVANQWVEPSGQYTGYHGYWTEHFKRVDKHFGTLDDYRRLSDALHRRGMYLIQDAVVNHTGNFFTYRNRWKAGDPAHGYEPHDRTAPVPRPSQPPFHQNDPRDPKQRRAAIYHWTPDIADYNDPVQEQTFQMAGLDDLNTENPVVRRALRDSFGFWVREVGVDALRIDTAFYVPPAFFSDFLHARDPRAPGLAEVARRTGRHNFHVFGEGFAMDRPFDDTQTRKIERYMTGPDSQPVLPGMINFPLYGALGDVFARGRPTAELAHRIEATMRLHARPHLMPTFVDNHDVDRFLAGGSEAGLRQALLAMFTLPGIPTVYYGTEQAFTQPRAAMFAAGWGSGGRDRYDTGAPLYRYIASLAQLRREHRLFSRGVPEVLKANSAAAGALAWRMTHEGRSALVVLNSADRPALLDGLDTGLPEGTVLQSLFTLEGPASAELVVGPQGRVSQALAARGGWVWQATGERRAVAGAAMRLALNSRGAQAVTTVSGDFSLSGTTSASGAVAPGASADTALQLVVDGDLSSARGVVPGPDGRWQVQVDTSAMVDPAVSHHAVVWAPAVPGTPAVALDFRVDRPWTLRADLEDPAGDDHGPRSGPGGYRYPTDPGWGANRQMDLRRVRVSTAGGALRMDLTMHEITTVWNPQNGFDHVAFTVFIELPGQPGGAELMPLQKGRLPEGMRWHRRLRVHGWTNALFSAEGASATAEGTPVSPAAGIAVDRATRTVRLTLPAASLGRLPSLDGARAYVTTWDYDGGYRALARDPAPFVMGGGDPEHDPLVMDDTPVILLK